MFKCLLFVDLDLLKVFCRLLKVKGNNMSLKQIVIFPLFWIIILTYMFDVLQHLPGLFSSFSTCLCVV